MLSPESNPPIKPRKIIRWICSLPSSPPTISHKRRTPLFFCPTFFLGEDLGIRRFHYSFGEGAGGGEDGGCTGFTMFRKRQDLFKPKNSAFKNCPKKFLSTEIGQVWQIPHPIVGGAEMRGEGAKLGSPPPSAEKKTRREIPGKLPNSSISFAGSGLLHCSIPTMDLDMRVLLFFLSLFCLWINSQFPTAP